MSHESVVYYNPADELDEELNINLKKIFFIIWSRKELILRVFASILVFFILLTFIMPKKYKVSADLYINKSNNSNMTEINPYVLNESSGTVVSMGSDKAINNEIELIKSALVLDKVIKDNNIIYKKKFGIIPNKKEGEFLSAKAFYNKGKKLKIENVKNTNIITIEYKANKPELAYGVVSSLITNYIELHKELNTEKSKADKKLIESEYTKAKEDLNKKLNQSSGLPVQSMTGMGNLSAMSAFSKSASRALGNIKGQYLAGEKSQIAVSEESQKVANLASKLEWAKMVEQMSDSSKVLVINEPQQLRPFENSSPKLLINIILGCVFGFIGSLAALIYAEVNEKKLSYSMLTDNILFDGLKDADTLKVEVLGYKPKNVLVVSFIQLPQNIINTLHSISNCEVTYADISEEFITKVSGSEKIIFISKIFTTGAETYKKIKNIVQKQQKEIVYDVLV